MRTNANMERIRRTGRSTVAKRDNDSEKEETKLRKLIREHKRNNRQKGPQKTQR